MTTLIPSAAEVRAALQRLPFRELKALSAKSGVPFTTLYKVFNGKTADPQIETVRKIWPHLQADAAEPAEAAGFGA